MQFVWKSRGAICSAQQPVLASVSGSTRPPAADRFDDPPEARRLTRQAPLADDRRYAAGARAGLY